MDKNDKQIKDLLGVIKTKEENLGKLKRQPLNTNGVFATDDDKKKFMPPMPPKAEEKKDDSLEESCSRDCSGCNHQH
jgi:hypothetical protein